MLTEGWKKYKLKELGEIVTGMTPSTTERSFWKGNIPFVTPGDLDHGRYVLKTERSVTEKGATRGRLLPKDSVLITCIASVGKMGMAGTACITNQQINAIICSANHDPSCVYFALSLAMERLKEIAGVNVIPIINKTLFGKLPLELPQDNAEQRAIAHVLNVVDSTIEEAKMALEKATQLKQALVQRVFSHGIRGERLKKSPVGLIPESWQVGTVASVVHNLEYGLSLPMSLTGATPILRMGNIQGGNVLLTNLKYVTLPPRILDRYLLKRGDVLFNRTNSQEHVGKVGIYRSDSPAVFASYLIRLNYDTNQINNYFLGQLLNSYSAQCRIKRYATPGVQQVNINATNLGKVLIPIPSGTTGLEEQDRISELLESADDRIRTCRARLQALMQLNRSMMSDLLTGRVRVDPELFRDQIRQQKCVPPDLDREKVLS